MSPATRSTATADGPRTDATGWWRRNRWALLALPVAVVFAGLAGSPSGRMVRDNWDWHRRLGPDSAGVVRFEHTYRDVTGEHRRKADLSVRAAEPVSEVTVRDLAVRDTRDDVTLWALTLHVDAPPDSSLVGCQPLMVDQQGQEHAVNISLLDSRQRNLGEWCVPAGAEGPWPDYSTGSSGDAPDQTPRPGEYDVTIPFALPLDAEPAELRVGWSPSVYPAVPVS